MRKRVMSGNRKGFTLTEIMFVVLIFSVVLASLLAAWLFTYRTWTKENRHTLLRVDLMKAMETIKSDMRLSSLTYMSYYPAGADTYTAVSMPVAQRDANGFFTLNASGEIDWDATVIYHVYTDAGGNSALRRTVFDPRDNTMTDAERYTQLAGTVTSGTGGAGSTTNAEFLENLNDFEIEPMPAIIDFYYDSADPVRVGKVVFGRATLDASDHTIRFEVTGKNSLSSGYDIGIDNIMIEPSGSVREMEYYDSSQAPGGMFSVSGGSAARVYDPLWDNGNYLEFGAAGEGSYMQIVDYYDLWRESSFTNSALDNTETIEEEVRVALHTPSEDEAGEVTWFGYAEAGGSPQEGEDSSVPGSSVPVTVRNIVTSEHIDQDGDMIRVSFISSSAGPLQVDRAYITKRDGTSGFNGLVNQSPGGMDVEDYHRHQQLFFQDESTGDITEWALIDPDVSDTVWSMWTAFPIRTDSDYFISFFVSNPVAANCKYWEGADSSVRSYYLPGNHPGAAGIPDWTGDAGVPEGDAVASNDIFVTAKIDMEEKTGKVESQIFNTSVTSPNYNRIKWSENRPAGATVSFKTRSSANADMSGASDWDTITGSGTNPHSLGIGSGQYVQFLAEMSAEPYWGTDDSTLSYASYISAQAGAGNPPYDFPRDGDGDIYTLRMDPPWIDDVEIDWPGATRLCTITGYIARKNDCGQAALTVDGQELFKTLRVTAEVTSQVETRTVTEKNAFEIEPKNTGN